MTEQRAWRVRGRVQGVWFRGATRERALALSLVGHAINLTDGSVRVVARGDPAALEQLQSWLRQGPPAARVESLEAETLTEACADELARVGAGFEVR